MTMKLYMQLFRPLYPDQQYGADGRHWYSADYGDLHIVSLSINRWFGYAKETSPGWYLFDGIGKSTPQYEWLKKDLRTAQNHKYIWVTQHWHMFNIGAETDVPYTNPVLDSSGKVAYDPAKDYLMRDIKPLFEKYGVDAVSFGHSHVYERFLVNGVNYIEAANIGNSYFNFNLDPSLYYSGNGTAGQYVPENVANIKEQNSNRSFLVVSVDKEDGMTAQGISASGPNTGDVFDLFTVAPSIWK